MVRLLPQLYHLALQMLYSFVLVHFLAEKLSVFGHSVKAFLKSVVVV